MTSERLLSLILRFAGILMLLALVAVFLPRETLNAANRTLLQEDLPEARIVDYLTRSVSLLYAAQGVITLYLSLHVRRYLTLLTVQAWVAIVLGTGMLLLDLRIKMPLLWALFEGPWIILLGLLVLGLVGRIREEERRAARKE